VKGIRWPIPEGFWVNVLIDKYLPRDPYPVLTVSRHHLLTAADGVSGPQGQRQGTVSGSAQGQAQGQGQGQGVSEGSPEYFLRLAKSLRIPLDTYEIAPAPGAPQSIKKSLGVGVEKCHVSVQGSGKTDTVDPAASVGSAILTNSINANLTINAMMSNTHVNPPFAILLPYSPVPGSCELKMMPFNYPVILPLMQRALEDIRRYNLPVAQAVKQPWMVQCQIEIYAYLFTVPSYAYPPVVEMLRFVGLSQYLKLDKSQDDHIHKVPFKRIQAMKGIAITGEPFSYLLFFFLPSCFLDFFIFFSYHFTLIYISFLFFSYLFTYFPHFFLCFFSYFCLPCLFLSYHIDPYPTPTHPTLLPPRYLLHASVCS
jgi:hypothetical protein